MSLVYHSMRFTVHWFRKGPEVSLQETQAQFFAFSLLASLHRVEPIRRKVRHNISIKSKNKMHLLGPRDQVSLLETVKAHHASMGRSRLLLNSLVFLSRVLVFRIARRYLQTPDRLWFFKFTLMTSSARYFRRTDVSTDVKLQPHPVRLFFKKVYFCMCFCHLAHLQTTCRATKSFSTTAFKVR